MTVYRCICDTWRRKARTCRRSSTFSPAGESRGRPVFPHELVSAGTCVAFPRTCYFSQNMCCFSHVIGFMRSFAYQWVRLENVVPTLAISVGDVESPIVFAQRKHVQSQCDGRLLISRIISCFGLSGGMQCARTLRNH